MLTTAHGFHQADEFGLGIAFRALKAGVLGHAAAGARIGADIVFQFPRVLAAPGGYALSRFYSLLPNRAVALPART